MFYEAQDMSVTMTMTTLDSLSEAIGELLEEHSSGNDYARALAKSACYYYASTLALIKKNGASDTLLNLSIRRGLVNNHNSLPHDDDFSHAEVIRTALFPAFCALRYG